MKIAYLMHIDWNWIKQRPQFIAEYLSEYYDIDVYYIPLEKDKRHQLTVNKSSGSIKKIRKLNKIPLSARSKIIKSLQMGINSIVCDFSVYDIIWICSPEVLFRIKMDENNLRNKIIIYDCMDDMIESHSVLKYRQELLSMEKRLIDISRIIFVSSNNLYMKMIERGADSSKLVKVFNGINVSSLGIEKESPPKKTSIYFTITYFGTISKWIDLDIIYRLLDDNDLENIRVTLIGPSDITIPEHERLTHLGPVKHSELKNHITDNDLFILPFIINPVTINVDPVKLYEYIAFHGNIAARFYPEIERFNEFIYFYNDYNELKKIILKLRDDNTLKYDTEKADSFLAHSSWDERVKVIIRHIECLFTEHKL